MFDTWRVYGPAGVLFPCSLVLMGTFVLMNLFLGILLGNFTSEDNGPDFEGFNTEPDKDEALMRTKRDSMVSMNSMSSCIADKVAGATEVLDDIADLLNEAVQSFAGMGATQTPSSPMEAILSGFISSMTSKSNHGNPLKEEWQIHENDSPPTLETENELD